LSLFQQFIHSLVERMAWPLRQFIVADPQPLLPLSAPSCPHRHRSFSRLRWHSTRTSDLRKLCSPTNKQKTDFHHRLLGEMTQQRTFLSIVEQLIEGNLKRPCQLLQSCKRGNEMPILDSRNVDAKQAAPFLDVTLGQILCFTNGAYAFADEIGRAHV